jgi:hypothetical protein
MRLKILLVVLLLPVAVVDARAQLCLYTFPGSSVCSATDCSVLISIQPSGVVRIRPDNRYGSELGINFGERGLFDLGDNGRINFGNSGGFQAVLNENSIPVCTFFGSGKRSYTVEMGGGGWLDFTGNNEMEFKLNNGFALGPGSRIDGRMDIQSDNSVGIVTAGGDIAMPNVDIEAVNGISLNIQGDMEIGDLRTEGTSANSGIDITVSGAVETGMVNTNGDFSVMAGGDISIETIGNADSIALTISPPGAGVITIGGQQTTDNPVICAPPDDCNDFQPDNGGGGSVNDCNTVSADPNVSRPGFILLLCMATFCRRCRRLPSA